MKNKKSILIIFALLLIGLAFTIIVNEQNTKTIAVIEDKQVLAYNPKASNILDNAYEKDGITILPIIYQNYDYEVISKDDVTKAFKNAKKTIKSISTNHIGTGTKIVTDTRTYNVIVFGDVDGDGYVDSFDAQAVLLHYVFGKDYTLTGFYKQAANVDNEDEEIDVFDAQRILLFYVGFENDLVVNDPKPTTIDDEKPEITIKGNNPQYIKLGESYQELGATVVDNVDKNPTLSIDASKVKTNTEGTYTVTYTAKDKSGNTSTKTRTVIVQDYIKEIKVTPPTKTTYKFSEDIDVTGGKVQIIKASGTTTINMQKNMLSGYNANKIGNQTITVTYEGKTATFSVIVDDYINGIEITSQNHKVDYKYNEDLDTTNLIVKPIYKGDSERKPIDIQDLDITGYNKTEIGTQPIKIEYTTNNTIDGSTKTFEATYNVYVTKTLENIIVTPKANTLIGYRYKTLEIATVEAGENQTQITTADLTFEIKDNSDADVEEEIATVTATDSQFDGQITISFMSKKAGIYKITPKVGTIIGDTVEVEIDEDTTVNKITFSGAIEGNFRVGHTKEIGISFTHKYEENVETQIDVAANRITIEGIDYDLKSGAGAIINVTQNPNTNVEKILFKATQEGQTTIKVYVDKGTDEEISETLTTITILPEAKIYVKLADTSDITLHTTTPSTTDSMVKEIDGKFYTLREIYLEDEDGNKTAVTRSNIINDDILIVDSLYTPQDLFISIDVKTFIEQNESIVETTQQEAEIKYIGIALKEGAETLLIGEKIIITYNQDTQNQIVLDINIPVQQISQVNVTAKADPVVGYCYQTFDIATVVSGTNEEEITSSNIEYEVKEVIDEATENNIDLSTTTDISITLEGPENQFTEEATIKFMSKKAGKYKITPKVGQIEGATINVEVDEDTTVTGINLIGISDGDTLAIGGQTKQIEIQFTHKYEESVERTIDVPASRITVEAEEIDYNLLTSAGVIITTQTEAKVGKINLTATETATEEEKTITITVDKGKTTEKSKTITVNVEQLTLRTVGNIEGITLYETETNLPTDATIEKDTDGTIYTLIPIELNDGSKVKKQDFVDEKIVVLDENDALGEWAMPITLKYYKTENEGITEVNSNTETVEYIGISAQNYNNILPSGNNIIIYYNEQSAITLGIEIKE